MRMTCNRRPVHAGGGDRENGNDKGSSLPDTRVRPSAAPSACLIRQSMRRGSPAGTTGSSPAVTRCERRLRRRAGPFCRTAYAEQGCWENGEIKRKVPPAARSLSSQTNSLLPRNERRHQAPAAWGRPAFFAQSLQPMKPTRSCARASSSLFGCAGSCSTVAACPSHSSVSSAMLPSGNSTAS